MSWAGKFLVNPIMSMMRSGEVVKAAVAGTTGNIRVMEYDEDHDIVYATGTDVPADTTSGYAKGCIFIDTDVAAGTTGRYENVGTSSSCNFDITSGLGAGNIDTAQLAADAVENAKIADDAVSLEHLDSGIAPSHVVVYAGESSWTGGGTSLAATVTGVAATDIVVSQFHTVPSEAAYIVSCAASENTITTTLSAANTTNDAVISYVVLRAAS